MKWLEIIILRTAGAPKPPHDELREIVDSLSMPGLIETGLYGHASIAGDLVFVLHWDTEEPKPWGSDLALGLKQELKQRGLVDYSVWTRIGGGKRPTETGPGGVQEDSEFIRRTE
jgi:hypothetical protein